MKKYFITGLVILLPLAVTIAVVVFVFNLLTDPFAGIVAQILDHYDLLEKDFFFASGHQVQYFISKLLILGFLIVFTIALGAIARYFFFRYLIKLWDYLLHRIPIVRTVYKASQDVISTIFTSSTKSFKQVVLVPFPNKEAQSIGLVTQDDLPFFSEKIEEPLVAVFVPTTPNPTSGFLMLYPRSEIVYLDMKVEEAFKYVISCGVIYPSFQIISYEQAKLSEPCSSKDKTL